MERKTECRPVWVEYICDKCGEGMMEMQSGLLLTDPPRHQHKCTHCGYEDHLFEYYPRLRWEPVKVEK